jgi:Protein of unknown function (DUF3318)
MSSLHPKVEVSSSDQGWQVLQTLIITEIMPMNRLMHRANQLDEMQRLHRLLPIELQSCVEIIPVAEVNPALISTQRVSQDQFMIQIDPIRWQNLELEQRDLLLWHEVARIQNRAIAPSNWELPVIAVGLIFSLIEIFAHNLIALPIELAITGLVCYRLYQRNQGEQSLRTAVKADCSAIRLAIAAGYSFSDAFDGLYSGVKRLAKQATQKSDWKKYQVRLRALEILALEQEKALAKSMPKLPISLSSPISSANLTSANVVTYAETF